MYITLSIIKNLYMRSTVFIYSFILYKFMVYFIIIILCENIYTENNTTKKIYIKNERIVKKKIHL